MYRSSRLLAPLTRLSFSSPSSSLNLSHSLQTSHKTIRPSISLARSNGLYPLLSRGYASEPPKNKSDGKGQDAVHMDVQRATSSSVHEVKGLSRDFADIISGSSIQAAAAGAREQSMQVSHKGNPMEDFMSITRTIITSVPKPALYTGLAGTLPYLATSISTVLLAREASVANQYGVGSITNLSLEEALSYLHTMEHVQITYGAIILSFLGAIHWGMEFANLGGSFGYRRLALGIVPVLFAWPTTFLDHGFALAAQWLGFTGMWLLDQRASANGWTTSWYSTYRFYLSIIVGFSIIGTFVGTNYYGSGAGALNAPRNKQHQHTIEQTTAIQRLDRLRERKHHTTQSSARVGKVEGKIGGDMAVEANESGDSYLVLKNVEKEEEKKRAEKEEQEEKAKKQDQKDEGQQKKAPGSMKSEGKNRTGNNEEENGKESEEEEGEGEEKKDNKKEEKGEDKKDDKKDDKKGDNKGKEKEGEDEGADGKGEGDGNKEGGDAGKSQAKKDDPKAKEAAGEKNTGKK